MQTSLVLWKADVRSNGLEKVVAFVIGLNGRGQRLYNTLRRPRRT